MSVRVRFAPSPTGLLHVGALRTVLFDWLLARNGKGTNILRIEDTDRTRYSPESEAEFIETLSWVGIDFDEGPHVGGPHAPYRQSERKEAGIYAKYIQELLDKGAAYKAFDTAEELAEMREYQQINKMPIGYFGGKWRDASPEEVAEAEEKGLPYVIRLKVPNNTKIVLEDAIRGRIEWDSSDVDDPVLIKSDGMPTYHFAAMVDDHLMGITHVLRGEEWIPSAPKHIALFEAFGWEKPVFVHCPVIVGKDGKKLSKRHGATRVLDYAAQGYMQHPLKNFVALIGWSPGEDREILSENELIELFSIKGIQPSPGRFDIEKLQWLNGHTIRSMSTEDLMQKIVELSEFPYAEDYHLNQVPEEGENTRPARWKAFKNLAEQIKTNPEYAKIAVKLEQERVTTLIDFGPACEFFFVDLPELDPKAVEKWLRVEHAPELFQTIKEACANVPENFEEAVSYWDSTLRKFQADKGIEKLGPIVHPTRVILTGKTVGPGLFELMAALGPGRIQRRLEQSF